MSASLTTRKPGQLARLICSYLKDLPECYADDPQSVQSALGLSDAEFQAGLSWCVSRKLIELDTKAPAAARSLGDGPAPAKPSPFLAGERPAPSPFGGDGAAKPSPFLSDGPSPAKPSPFLMEGGAAGGKSPFHMDHEKEELEGTANRLTSMLRTAAMAEA